MSDLEDLASASSKRKPLDYAKPSSRRLPPSDARKNFRRGFFMGLGFWSAALLFGVVWGLLSLTLLGLSCASLRSSLAPPAPQRPSFHF